MKTVALAICSKQLEIKELKMRFVASFFIFLFEISLKNVF